MVKTSLVILSLAAFLTSAGRSETSFACNLKALSGEQRKQHAQLSRSLFSAVTERRELTDGYATPEMEERLFSSREVSVISGVTGRQLQWWDENEIISPLRRDGRRAYDTQQLLEVLVIAAFRRKQLSLQKIRRVMRLLRRKK